MLYAAEYLEVTCGALHCCGVLAAGYPETLARNVECWGSTQYRQTNVPDGKWRLLQRTCVVAKRETLNANITSGNGVSDESSQIGV